MASDLSEFLSPLLNHLGMLISFILLVGTFQPIYPHTKKTATLQIVPNISGFIILVSELISQAITSPTIKPMMPRKASAIGISVKVFRSFFVIRRYSLIRYGVMKKPTHPNAIASTE